MSLAQMLPGQIWKGKENGEYYRVERFAGRLAVRHIDSGTLYVYFDIIQEPQLENWECVDPREWAPKHWDWA